MANHIFIPSTLKTTASNELEKEILKDLQAPAGLKSIAQLLEEQNEKEESAPETSQKDQEVKEKDQNS